MDLQDTLIYRVQSLSRRLDYVLANVVKLDGAINYAQYRVLVAIHEAGKTTLTAVAGWLDLTVPTVSHLCYKLQSEGYIHVGLADGKAKKLSLTPQGVDTIMRLNPQLEAVLDDCFDALSVHEQQMFINLINKIQTNLTVRELQC